MLSGFLNKFSPYKFDFNIMFPNLQITIYYTIEFEIGRGIIIIWTC